MATPKSLVDMSEGTAVSKNSPQSPTGSALLETPITLDFDPMSFQLKEDSPLTSPSDNSPELCDTPSPSQNADVIDFFDPFCPVKEESPTDYYPNVMLGQTIVSETLLDSDVTECDQGFSNFHMNVEYHEHENVQDNVLEKNLLDEFVDDQSELPVSQTPYKYEPVSEFEPEAEFGPDTIIEPLTEFDLIKVSEPVVTNFDQIEKNQACVFESVEEQVFDDQHALDQEFIPQHEQCEDDLSRRSRTSSAASSHSSKSERHETKTSRKSSDSSYKEDYTSKKAADIISVKKESHKKELSNSKEKNVKSEKTNGYSSHNGFENAIHLKNGLDSELESNKTSQMQTSVTNLMSTYVHLTSQDSLPLPSAKEVIETGINVKTLKSNYVQRGGENRGISPDREIISTGIDLQALKSSFTKSDDESHQNTFQDEIKPSVDRVKVQRTFSQSAHDEVACSCKICGKHVYQMEKMKAEKNVFHKNCFRCKECNKLLTVDSYSSNEGDIYCKPHFRQLFQPKARFDGEDGAPRKQRRNEMIIRENVPAELPPDVIRSDSKPDHGLENIPVNLHSIKSKFESHREEHHLPSTTDVCTLQRSASVMARLAKYQSAVSGDLNENGEMSESDNEENYDDSSVMKSSKHKEKVVFSGMSSLKSQWETGSVVATKEEKIEEKKEELNKLRQRICLGRSESMKAVYEKACQDTSKVVATRTEPVDLGREVKATRIKERFEKGDLVSEVEEENLEKARKEKEEDLSVFTEPGIANDAKKLFQQIDATVKSTTVISKSPNKSPLNENFQPSLSEVDVVKCSEPTEKEEIVIDTTGVTQRFKFFENYSESPKERKRFQITPPREPAKEDTPDEEVMHDPNVIRCGDVTDDIPQTDTATRMLDKFKALEKEAPSVPAGPKPLKRITPPREYIKTDENHEPSPDPESIIHSSYKAEDDIIVEADKAKSLRAKFENWDTELRENRKNEEEEEEDFLPQVDTTKTLRAKFEAIKEDTLKPLEKPKPKVNRFIQEQTCLNTDMCSICEKKVYPMEKMETSGMRLHKNCFRCAHCSCMLRLENYTTSAGRLYCTPHFKQLFISKGNYDEGFGREQHKEKWNRSCNNTPVPRDLHENGDIEYSNGDVPCLEQTV